MWLGWLLNYCHRDVPEVDVFLAHVPACAALRDEAPLSVVVEDRVPLGVGLADPLAEGIHLVVGRADRGHRLGLPPAGVVGVHGPGMATAVTKSVGDVR